GDNSLRQIEASAASNPVLSPYWQQLKQENARQLNTLAARAMGVEADNVGAAVRAQAERQIGDAFREVGEGLGSVPTKKLYSDLQSLAAEEATGGLPTREAWNVLKRFESGMQGRAGAVGGEVADDVMSGADLLRMRSQVSKQMRDAFAANKADRGDVLGAVLERIDDTIGKAALATGRAKLVEKYDKARDSWTVLRAVDRGAASQEGNVMTGRMAQILGASDKTRFWGRADDAGQTLQRTGTGKLGEDAMGDFYDAVRFASSQLGRDIVGDSGTATRLATSGIFEGGPLGVATRAGAYAARRAVAGPLARRYMDASPEAAQVWQAALERSALAGWGAGQRAGAVAARGGQAVQQSLPPGMNESGMLPPGY
ncbi:MAG TPA: hypothetical protein VLC08_16370, partial [Chitinolyticbacter sp.]|nr:hypothetical protein [Chitinolyticbacter sp.]